jgi:hypothetical protein
MAEVAFPDGTLRVVPSRTYIILDQELGALLELETLYMVPCPHIDWRWVETDRGMKASPRNFRADPKEFPLVDS